ncbi:MULTISPECIES: hypothetical protein [Lachnospiraceae]|uniref:hypothetical protein n=2 Tax=Bacillota TaxID=1239 RepID=UPI00155930F6|nr:MULTISPECIES: hypothetical protein [Lachnospiraceae]MBT9805802.1 hypothetical protein [Blautia wexlerae]MCR2048275.1 hypothetical protein [Acetatifactor muris]MDB8010433.1 hypothetical protein [Agathobacter rectalis]MDB8013075.1 hypothetical protein [Agathobacter rectalis]
MFDFPFHTPHHKNFKNCQTKAGLFEKFFEDKAKYARLQNANGRKGIVSSIQLITQFIFMGKVCPGGGRAFFDKSRIGEFCRYGLCFTAATSFRRRFNKNRVLL